MIARRPYFPPVPREIASLFAAEGLALLGVADAERDEAEERRYRAWIEKGYAGSMGYLAAHAPLKFHPRGILAGCSSVLIAGINYFQSVDGGRTAPARGRIARYAWGRDYHKVLGAKLRRVVSALRAAYSGEEFRSFTDASPLAERHYAEKAGIGFTGRNTLLISSQFGSWFLIGEILSTRRFPPSGTRSLGRASGPHGGCPSGCRRCLDVCPTGALASEYEIDASRCISYLTIEHKGSIPVELRPLMGDWLFGCDLCQEVCPLNLRAQGATERDFVAWRAGSHLELEGLLSIESEEAFANRFAGSPLMRAKRSGLLRNACVVAANLGAVELLPRLRALAGDRDPVIAEHARYAVELLSAGGCRRAASCVREPVGLRADYPQRSRR